MSQRIAKINCKIAHLGLGDIIRFQRRRVAVLSPIGAQSIELLYEMCTEREKVLKAMSTHINLALKVLFETSKLASRLDLKIIGFSN
jgi:hypothetical protein